MNRRCQLTVAVATAVSLSCCACVPVALAGAWPQSADGYYLELESSYLRASQERNHLGERVPIFSERLNFTDATYEEVNARVYGEYGVTRNFTVIGRLFAKYAEEKRTELGGIYFENFRNNTWSFGLGDLTAGARVGLLRAPVVASVESQLKIPLGYDASPENATPPIGNGEVDVDARLLLGRSFGPVYATGTAGYRVRGGVFHDEWLYELEVGSESANWFAQLKVEGVENTHTPQDLAGAPIQLPLPGGGGAFPVIVGDQNWSKLRGALARRIGSTWLKLSLVDVVAGKNTIDGTEVAIGLYVKR